MGLITLTGLVLFFAVNAAMQRAEQALSQRKFNADERLVSKVLEYVQGIAEVKNFDLTHDSATQVHGAVEEAVSYTHLSRTGRGKSGAVRSADPGDAEGKDCSHHHPRP